MTAEPSPPEPRDGDVGADRAGEGRTGVDPVRVDRARVARLVSIGQQLGYGLFAIAVVAFFVGFGVGFTRPVVLAIEGCLLIGSLVLAPAIVFGYAVKAAERDDREHGR